MLWTLLLDFFYSRWGATKPSSTSAPVPMPGPTSESAKESHKPQALATTQPLPPVQKPAVMSLASQKVGRIQSVSINDLIFSIDSIQFMGIHSKSYSGEWIIAWDDSDGGGRGGNRADGNGQYILYDCTNNEIVVNDNKLQRPMKGSVADNGFFCFEDWMFGNDLSGVFYIFSPTGVVMLTKKFTANLFNSAISQNGRFAACHTSSGYTDDSNRLVFFDVINSCEIFSIQTDIERPEAYEFDEENRELIVGLKDLGKFRYSESGEFIDVQKYKDAKLNSINDFTAIREAEELLKNPSLSVEKVREILSVIISAKPRVGKFHSDWKATALKLQGLAHEKLGEDLKAIKAYEEAISLNPKVGVKRKMGALKKKKGLC